MHVRSASQELHCRAELNVMCLDVRNLKHSPNDERLFVTTIGQSVLVKLIIFKYSSRLPYCTWENIDEDRCPLK